MARLISSPTAAIATSALVIVPMPWLAASTPPASVPEQNGEERAHLEHRVTADELGRMQDLRQQPIFRRREKRRVHTEQKQRAQQRGQMA